MQCKALQWRHEEIQPVFSACVLRFNSTQTSFDNALDGMVHASNSSTREAQEGGSLQVQGQPGLHSKTMSQK